MRKLTYFSTCLLLRFWRELPLYSDFGPNRIFARAGVMKTRGLIATSTTELMRKMKRIGLIESTAGRRKYRFTEPAS